jgi:hypothetical protein
MEHSVHVLSSKVVESVSPASSATILKRIRNTIKRAQDDNANPDLSKVDADLAALEHDPGGRDGNLDESDDEDDFGSGDAVRKALSLVKQVSDVVRFIFNAALILLQI